MNKYVYVSSSESQQIHVWKLNTEESLILIQIVNVPGNVQPMVISPDKKFLYIGVRPRCRVLTYQISQTDGTLTWISEAPLPGHPTYISTDHQGRFLFSASYNSGCVSVTHLENGIPNKIVDVIEGLDGCHSANVSPDNHLLWVPVLKQDRTCIFTIENNGKLTKQTFTEIKTTKGAGPRHMVFHPNQQYAYIINELIGSIDVWKISDINKNTACIQKLSVIPPIHCRDTRCWAADIHLTSDGRYLYACDRMTNLISTFRILKDNCMLEFLRSQHTEKQPRSFDIDYSGKYLIVAGQLSHYITLYKIENTKQGFLKKQGRYAVGNGPIWVVINN